ncbi:MAG: transglycosylase domain-containing protein [Angustibacter sp.]
MARIVDYPRRGRYGVRRFIPSWKLVLGTGASFASVAMIGFAILYSQVAVPDPNELVTANASVVYWSDGRTELGRYADVNRRSIPLEQMPEALRNAVLAAEDRSFYENSGFSPRGIGRAVWVKLRGGSTQGGSTITQQYVKNYFLTQDRTATRKAKEFVIALKVEQQESKDKILENYLNTIYFGRGAWGVEAASRAYFAKPANKLTLSQSALLAAVLRSPGLYDPITKRDNAKERWNYVLGGMVEEGWLSQAVRDKAKFPPVRKSRAANTRGGTTGYLLEAVREEVKAKVGLTDADIDRGGLRIVSTFDQDRQDAAVAAIKEELPTTNAKGVGAGLVAIKPGDGAVVAMYGGPDAVKRPYNTATQAVLQAGSTFKPFALVAALQTGTSLRSQYSGQSPMTFDNGYTVANFGNTSYQTVDLTTATANSINTVYVALNRDVGPERTMQVAIDAGYPEDTTGLEANASNVLGTASPHVIDVARAYATFAAQGERAETYMVRSVKDTSGATIWKASITKKRVFSPEVSADLTFALSGVVQQGSGSFAGQNLGRPAAGKTGTTQENRSAWFAGYTPQLATAVGLYRQIGDRTESLNGLGGLGEVTGATFPVRIWTAFMQAAMDGQEIQQFPPPVYGGDSNVPAPPDPTGEELPPPSPTSTPPPSTGGEVTPTGPMTTNPTSPSMTPTVPPQSTTPTRTRTRTRPPATPTVLIR